MQKRKLGALALAMSLGLSLVGCGTDAKQDVGSVYYLNFKPEAAAVWKEIAKTYTKETGVSHGNKAIKSWRT